MVSEKRRTKSDIINEIKKLRAHISELQQAIHEAGQSTSHNEEKYHASVSNYGEGLVHDEALRSAGILSAAMVRQLNHSLTTIRLSIQDSLEELEKASGPETILALLNDALWGVARADSIINGFRKAARTVPQKTVSKISVAAVARDVVSLFEDSARRAKVDLCLMDMGNLPPVRWNRRDLEQLFYVLVQNAVEAADGKKRRQLCVAGNKSDDHVELQFSDNCGGIRPEHLDRIFEPFFTTRAARAAPGLGLWIAQRLVSGAGGRVWVESTYGIGSTFFVSLPINRGRN